MTRFWRRIGLLVCGLAAGHCGQADSVSAAELWIVRLRTGRQVVVRTLLVDADRYRIGLRHTQGELQLTRWVDVRDVESLERSGEPLPAVGLSPQRALPELPRLGTGSADCCTPLPPPLTPDPAPRSVTIGYRADPLGAYWAPGPDGMAARVPLNEAGFFRDIGRYRTVLQTTTAAAPDLLRWPAPWLGVPGGAGTVVPLPTPAGSGTGPELLPAPVPRSNSDRPSAIVPGKPLSTWRTSPGYP